jgi:hypothetical protein
VIKKVSLCVMQVLCATRGGTIHNDYTYGVLKLALHPKSCDWRFFPVEGEASTDSGRGRCYRRKFARLHLPTRGDEVPF